MAKTNTMTIHVDDEKKKQLKAYLYGIGKSMNSALIEEINYMVKNNIPIEKPVENFLDIREKLIEKYGSIKEASRNSDSSYQSLMAVIYKIEKNKNYKPKKSTISMLSQLIEK